MWDKSGTRSWDHPPVIQLLAGLYCLSMVMEAWAHICLSLAEPSLKHAHIINSDWSERLSSNAPLPPQPLLPQLILHPVTLNPVMGSGKDKRDRTDGEKGRGEGQWLIVWMREIQSWHCSVLFFVLWYAGERGLPGGLGWEPDGAEHSENGSVPVHHQRWCTVTAGAGGAATLSVGGALWQG